MRRRPAPTCTAHAGLTVHRAAPKDTRGVTSRPEGFYRVVNLRTTDVWAELKRVHSPSTRRAIRDIQRVPLEEAAVLQAIRAMNRELKQQVPELKGTTLDPVQPIFVEAPVRLRVWELRARTV